MKILIVCEESQEVCKAFRAKGHAAYSCDLKPCSGGHPEWHLQCDCYDAIYENDHNFLGAHPVCKYLTNSGVRWLAKKNKAPGYEWDTNYNIFINWERHSMMVKGAIFFNQLLDAVESTGKGYVENPIMHKYAREIINRPYSQIIQPYQFGHMESKATCLWVRGLPLLEQTSNVYDKMIKLPKKEQNKIWYMSPGKDRQCERSKTYPGIAEAMAEQWGIAHYSSVVRNRNTSPVFTQSFLERNK